METYSDSDPMPGGKPLPALFGADDFLDRFANVNFRDGYVYGLDRGLRFSEGKPVVHVLIGILIGVTLSASILGSIYYHILKNCALALGS